MPGGRVVSLRLNIICTAVALALVNATLSAVDPDSSGDAVTLPLRLAGTQVNGVAFGCSWATDDLVGSALRQAIRDAGWRPKPTGSEMTVYVPGVAVPGFASGQRVWVFDGDQMPFGDCLAALGLDYPYDPPRV